MIKNWQSHQEYRHFLHEAKVHFDDSQRTRLSGEFATAREKLRLLNLDPVMELLEPYYPPFGRPAVNQPQILRSLILMLDQGYTSITAWVDKLNSDSLLAKTKSLLISLEKGKNFRTGILRSQKLWLMPLFPGMNFLFIMKSFYIRYSAPQPLPLPYSVAL